jgi:signal transduction histidine kinase
MTTMSMGLLPDWISGAASKQRIRREHHRPYGRSSPTQVSPARPIARPAPTLYFQPMRDWWERLGRIDGRAVDWAIAVALTVLTQIQIGSPASAEARAALLLTLILGFRRRAPLAVAVVAGIAVGLQGLSDNPPSNLGEFASICLAVYTVAAEEGLERALLGGVAILAGVAAHDVNSEEYGTAAGMASDLTPVVVFWLVGRAVRMSRARAHEATAEAGRAAEGERRRIARELHDVVTHSLGVVVLQAQGARRVLDGREPPVDEALEAIERSGRAALVEMRRLLGLLRDEDREARLAPRPRVAELERLVGEVRATGLDVDLRIEGEPVALEPGVDLSGYRIVQEALTNTLRHAEASHASVVVRYVPGALELEVTDDGRGVPNGRAAGRGLLGMRERVAVFGGALEHGSRDATPGYRVWTRLPTEPA